MSADSLNIAVARTFVPRLSRIVALTGVVIMLATPGPRPGSRRRSTPRTSARGNAVTHWNAVATDAFTPSQGTNPMAQSRTLAILHAAMHDALNAIDRRFEAYTPGLDEAPGASVDAAVAAAARDVLVALLPDQAALVEAAYDRALAAVPDGPAKTAGIATGQASAAANITRRQGDGFDEATQPVYVPRPGSRGVSVHATIQLRRAARLGTRQAVHHRARRARGRRAASLVQHPVRPRPRIREGYRRHRQHDPHARTIGDRAVLVRGFAARMEPDREHGRPTARPGSLVGGARVRAGQLRDGGRVHRGFRGQVSVPLLATGDGDPRGGDRWQSR